MDAMGHLVDDLIARTHELLQPNPGWLISHHLFIRLLRAKLRVKQAHIYNAL